MKKLITIILAGILVFSLCACGEEQTEIPAAVQKQVDSVVADLTGTGENAAGGWTKQDPTDLTDEEKEVFDNAIAAAQEEAEDEASDSAVEAPAYTPLALEATQVVAGLNYCFLCEVTTDGQTEYQLLYVYRDLEGNAEITDTLVLNG